MQAMNAFKCFTTHLFALYVDAGFDLANSRLETVDIAHLVFGGAERHFPNTYPAL